MANSYYQPLPTSPPKRDNTAWIVLGAVIIAILLCCGGCTALFGLGLLAEPVDEVESNSSASSASQEPEPSPTRRQAPRSPSTSAHPGGELGNDTPRDVTPGKSFVHDRFRAAAGWRVVEDDFLGATIEGLTVTNEGGDRRTALLTFRFYDGKTVLGEINCSSNQMQSGESSAMDCFSLDSEMPVGYDAVKVSDAW